MESALLGFYIEKHKWHLIDTVRIVKSGVIYLQYTKTTKAKNLKVYEYVEYILVKMSKHEDGIGLS